MVPRSLRVSIPLAAALLAGAPVLHAQLPFPLETSGSPNASNVTPPPFDVVSVKEHHNDGGPMMIRLGATPNGYEAQNFALKDLLSQAYGIRSDLISGLPDWASSTRYDVTAKVAAEDVPTLKKLSSKQRAAMIIPVLEDRFHLKSHTEVRTLPTYDLVVDKGGSKLTAASAPVPSPAAATDATGEKKAQNRRHAPHRHR